MLLRVGPDRSVCRGLRGPRPGSLFTGPPCFRRGACIRVLSLLSGPMISSQQLFRADAKLSCEPSVDQASYLPALAGGAPLTQKSRFRTALDGLLSTLSGPSALAAGTALHAP